jgi:hypothetical protein
MELNISREALLKCTFLTSKVFQAGLLYKF